jgi:hypothetical protein
MMRSESIGCRRDECMGWAVGDLCSTVFPRAAPEGNSTGAFVDSLEQCCAGLAEFFGGSSVMPELRKAVTAGRLVNLSSGVIAFLGRYTRLMRPGFFGSARSVEYRHGRWKFKNGLRYSTQNRFKRVACRWGMRA